MSKKLMMLLSIVEREKGKKLRKELRNKNIRVNFQIAGTGTAPTEMMDIFGFGTIDKDIVISLGAESDVREMKNNFGTSFSSHSKYGGIMIILEISAAGRILTEIMNFNTDKNTEKETVNMKNEHHNNLIVISLNQGYTEDVMQVARKAGATGGTVIRGRLTDSEQFAEINNIQVDDEREILFILAPLETSKKIMEDVNRVFGVTSPANGIIFAVPAEKAYRI